MKLSYSFYYRAGRVELRVKRQAIPSPSVGEGGSARGEPRRMRVLGGMLRGRKGYEINALSSEVSHFFQHPSSDLAFGSATFSHKGRRGWVAQQERRVMRLEPKPTLSIAATFG